MLSPRDVDRQFCPVEKFVRCPKCTEGELLRIQLLFLEGALTLGVLGEMLTAEEEEELLRLHHADGDVGEWLEQKREDLDRIKADMEDSDE